VNEIKADFEQEIEYPLCGEANDLDIVEIYLSERSRLKRIIAGMGLNVVDCEDVLQNVSIKAMQQSIKLDAKQDVLRWLIKVTVNECLVEHRRRKSFLKKADEILKRKSKIQTGPADKNAIQDIEEQLANATTDMVLPKVYENMITIYPVITGR